LVGRIKGKMFQENFANFILRFAKNTPFWQNINLYSMAIYGFYLFLGVFDALSWSVCFYAFYSFFRRFDLVHLELLNFAGISKSTQSGYENGWILIH